MMELVKKIREKTGAGVVDIRKALDEAEGNEDKAIEILRQKGSAKALKKADREAKEGIIISYIHSNNKVGALVKLYCETDFVGRNEEFKELGRDIAMQVVAMNPQFVKPEEVSAELVEKEKSIWIEQLKSEGKPAEIMEKIMAGKEKKFREEISLLTQPFVKDPERTVSELITEKISKTGENIQIGDFVRFEL
jgi:elongation factor Ts